MKQLAFLENYKLNSKSLFQFNNISDSSTASLFAKHCFPHCRGNKLNQLDNTCFSAVRTLAVTH